MHEPDLQLLQRGDGGPQHRRHDHLRLGLRLRDPSVDEHLGQPVEPTFPAAGTYTVTLTTTDGWGKSASTTREITVGTPPPSPQPASLDNERERPLRLLRRGRSRIRIARTCPRGLDRSRPMGAYADNGAGRLSRAAARAPIFTGDSTACLCAPRPRAPDAGSPPCSPPPWSASCPPRSWARFRRPAAAAPTLSYVGIRQRRAHQHHPLRAHPRRRAGRRHARALHDQQLAQRHADRPDRLDAAAGPGGLGQPRPGVDQEGRPLPTRNAMVTARTSVTVKSTLSVAAYRSSAGTSAVTASASATVATGATSHRTPATSATPARLVAAQLLGRQDLHHHSADLDPPDQRDPAYRRQRASARTSCRALRGLERPPGGRRRRRAPGTHQQVAHQQPAHVRRGQPRPRAGQPGPGRSVHVLLQLPRLHLRRRRVLRRRR